MRIIRDAKARGVRVTCETAPHYFSLTDDAVRGYNTNAKMNPPLREAEDVAAIKAGLADGTIDAIATDHAPHHLDEKDVEFNLALNGIIGLETSLPLSLRLVEEGVLDLKALVEKMSCNPAQILGIERGTLQRGSSCRHHRHRSRQGMGGGGGEAGEQVEKLPLPRAEDERVLPPTPSSVGR